MLVGRFHGAAAAAAARRGFEERFQQRHLDAAALDEISVEAKDGRIWLPGLLREAKLVKSNSEARRLLKQRAVRIDGATVESEDYPSGAAASSSSKSASAAPFASACSDFGVRRLPPLWGG